MLTPEERARRRDLQRRAYAAGGGLTQAEAAELHRLNARHRVAASAPDAAEAPVVRSVTDGVKGPDAVKVPDAADAELEEMGEFAPGSVQFQGSKNGADVWVAMQMHLGPPELQVDRPCLIVSMPDRQRAMDCGTGEDTQTLRQVDVTFEHEGVEQSLAATLHVGLGGRYGATIDTVGSDFSVTWSQQFSPEDRALYDMLVDSGYDGSTLRIAGYDGATPVWIADSDQPCLIVVAADQISQACRDSSIGEGESLNLGVGDRMYHVHHTRLGYTLTVTDNEVAAEGER